MKTSENLIGANFVSTVSEIVVSITPGRIEDSNGTRREEKENPKGRREDIILFSEL